MDIVRVRYEHYRPMLYGYDKTLYRYTRGGPNKTIWMPDSTSGKTRCILEVKLGDHTGYIMGEADCSKNDAFCYKTGREIAEFRARRIYSAYKALEQLLEEREWTYKDKPRQSLRD